MTTLQLLGAMLVGGMIFGWPIALLILRLAENDVRYRPPVEPRAFNPATCVHPIGWVESAGVEPDDALRLCVRLRCRMCGDDDCLLPIRPHQGRHDPASNVAHSLEVVHGANLHERPFAVLSETQRDRQARGVSSVPA